MIYVLYQNVVFYFVWEYIKTVLKEEAELLKN